MRGGGRRGAVVWARANINTVLGSTNKDLEHLVVFYTLNWNWISLFPLCHHWVSEYVIWTIKLYIFFPLLTRLLFFRASLAGLNARLCHCISVCMLIFAASIGKTFIFYNPTQFIHLTSFCQFHTHARILLLLLLAASSFFFIWPVLVFRLASTFIICGAFFCVCCCWLFFSFVLPFLHHFDVVLLCELFFFFVLF